jgi:hypothetical protein
MTYKPQGEGHNENFCCQDWSAWGLKSTRALRFNLNVIATTFALIRLDTSADTTIYKLLFWSLITYMQRHWHVMRVLLPKCRGSISWFGKHLVILAEYARTPKQWLRSLCRGQIKFIPLYSSVVFWIFINSEVLPLETANIAGTLRHSEF